MKEITYLDRLKSHPGVPTMFKMTGFVVVLFTILVLRDGGIARGIVGSIMSVAPFWVIVLWTARTQPVYGENDEG